MAEPVDAEIAEVQRLAAEAITATIRAATQVAHALIKAYALRLRRAAQVDAEAASRARATLDGHRRAALTVMTRVQEDSWWRKAPPAEIARVWTAAVTWGELDPRAAETLRVMKTRLAATGVVIDESSLRPEDARDVTRMRDALTVVMSGGSQGRVDPDPEVLAAQRVLSAYPQNAHGLTGQAAHPLPGGGFEPSQREGGR